MTILAILLCLSLGYLVPHQVDAQTQIHPSVGFLPIPLNQSNFVVQRSYDVPVDQRYSFKDGAHTLYVFDTDKPHSPTSKTGPRTKVRIHGYDYSSGVWQFEGQGYVPSGTTGVCIMQVFGTVGHETTAMLRVYNGTLYYHSRQVLVENIYDRWFQLNVIHDIDDSNVKIYIDGQLKYEAPGSGGASHYFKFGVYSQDNKSHCMESRWKDVKVLKMLTF
ncbi:citrate-binding protein-like [Rhodamnia argentea]|uniref:Citrate-binding protein-like n=1 Tax=Rhodamnia argentea TaxID=178133 RepID=A0A8B8PLF4_9MYRT|nr:citrate-binding protein-like [Rhodamnia argentea]